MADPIRTPNCPRCGQPPAMAMSQQFWCDTEDCKVMSWNPYDDAATFEANARVVDFGLWPCMVCGEERPDAQISVAHRDWEGMEKLPDPQQWNVRYCNDRPACVAYATADGPWTGRPVPDETGGADG